MLLIKNKREIFNFYWHNNLKNKTKLCFLNCSSFLLSAKKARDKISRPVSENHHCLIILLIPLVSVLLRYTSAISLIVSWIGFSAPQSIQTSTKFSNRWAFRISASALRVILTSLIKIKALTFVILKKGVPIRV